MLTSSPDDNRVEPIVQAQDLNVHRGKNHILHDVSLELPPGSVTGLLGPSGCGKTTLMRSIVGVQKTSGGVLRVFGDEPGAPANRGRTGYVTQQASVYRDLTVRDNLEYFSSLFHGNRDEQAVIDALEAVNLEKFADSNVEDLSGGQAGRASLACALVGLPDLLVLDEPTVGLDPVTREDLWERFHGLAQNGTTLLVSSHVMDEATRCDQLILMRDGRILGIMSPQELLERTHAETPDEAFLTLIRDSDQESNS
ncbi:ABC transporter ATP-binding protein [Corynebacterium uberis]|uniref:ABC transporter ATP-binding protein n=1 Tax=Corynebacterium TaxID=1716 RepID=UPI001D0B62FF|nr:MULTISPECIES: ABC transporter ATP-binding protein [Corynebacterium]MCZ9308678.1 ABC transporter ATP-binding protein [Corynebacterium sp. c6VSa_13]UDL74317.1 ABC transporter ATP-binding protein [Corynebacterium uberis]UDL76850.1 ABC transporter ATP-binding protein [Corynebacterium uberis]UDL79063.1 ABC transporter ATP-binding protein [Corynebacterium uberis]UDL79301.1 ABC transporter ATP-binding protein [Corynebacterium uberis]